MNEERAFEALVERTLTDDEVLGLVLTGSRGRGPFARPDSDWDVRLVVRDDSGADTDYETPHGSQVEVVVLSWRRFERAGMIGSDDEWDRYSYAHAQVVVDKLDGRIGALVAQKGALTEEEASAIARPSLGAYINSYFRSSTNLAAGRSIEGRLDAGESVSFSPFLTALFALHLRVRPFNKFLIWELETYPLGGNAWNADRLTRRLAAVAQSDLAQQRTLFTDIEKLARERGFGDAFDEWGPELPWLRGRSTS